MPLCPATLATKTARGVPPQAVDHNVDWMRRHAWTYPGKRWLRGREVLVRALEHAGVRLQLISVGCGSFGCVYPVEGRADVVCKVTGDASEAAAALTVLRAGRAIPHLVAYSCVYGVRGAPMWALLMERLQPLNATERRFIAESENEFDAAADPAFGGVANQEARTTLEGRARRMLGDKGVRQSRGLVRAVEQLRAIGVQYHDLHRGNVLKDARGTWKIIDLGVSVAPAQAAPRLGGWSL